MRLISRTKFAMQLAVVSFAIIFAAASSAQRAEKNATAPVITDAWVKTTIPGGSVSAAYMNIKSATPLQLVKAESPVAGMVEIHDMKMNDGVMEMKALDAVNVPANKLVKLSPGGMHVMLMRVKKPITKGDKVPLTLTFEDEAKKLIVVTLDAIAKEDNAGGHKH